MKDYNSVMRDRYKRDVRKRETMRERYERDMGIKRLTMHERWERDMRNKERINLNEGFDIEIESLIDDDNDSCLDYDIDDNDDGVSDVIRNIVEQKKTEMKENMIKRNQISIEEMAESIKPVKVVIESLTEEQGFIRNVDGLL